jgi:RHS repeat-associated protein
MMRVNIAHSGYDTNVYGLTSLNVYTEQDGAGRTKISCDGIGEPQQANQDTIKSCGLAYYTFSGFPTTYAYNPAGDLTSATLGGTSTSETKSYFYDMAGRITSQTLPEETASESFGYDSQIPGGLHTYTDARGITTTYTLDNLYRPTSIAFSDGTPTITNAYDLTTQTNGIGRLSTTSTSNTISGFNYDAMGRMNLKGEQGPMLFGKGNTTIGYGFDFAGNLTSLADSASNNTLIYSRNGIGQLTGITASYAGTGEDIVPTILAGEQQAFVYNALGLPTALSGASWPRTYTYDQMGRLISMGDTGLEPYSLSIGRDSDGKVTSVNDQILGSWTYGYDNNIAGGRLTSATCTTGNGTCANGYGGTSWTYDQYGNRWTQTAYKGLNTTFTYDTQSGGAMHNRIIGSSTSYDAAGDMLTDTIPNTYTYDAMHRIKTASMNSSSFVYDGLGNRVEDANATGTFDWYYDGTSILHFDTSATTKGLGMKAGFGEYHGAPGAMRYYEDWRDQVGNLRQQQEVLTVISGYASQMQNSQTYVSLPFGDSYLDTNQNSSEDTDLTSKFFFGGMMQIGGVNFSENRANNIQIGRWLTPDPAHVGWNAYVYASNNPVTLSDPSGLGPCDETDSSDCPDNPQPQPNVNDPCGNGGTGGCTGGGEPNNPNGNQNPLPNIVTLQVIPFDLTKNDYPFELAQDDSNQIVMATNTTLFWGSASNFPTLPAPGSRLPNGDVAAGPMAQQIFQGNRQLWNNAAGTVNALAGVYAGGFAMGAGAVVAAPAVANGVGYAIGYAQGTLAGGTGVLLGKYITANENYIIDAQEMGLSYFSLGKVPWSVLNYFGDATVANQGFIDSVTSRGLPIFLGSQPVGNFGTYAWELEYLFSGGLRNSTLIPAW